MIKNFGLNFWKPKKKNYSILFWHILKIVLVKSGEKDAEKRFLGYEFSNEGGKQKEYTNTKDKILKIAPNFLMPIFLTTQPKQVLHLQSLFRRL